MRILQLSDPHFGTILPGVRESLLKTIKDLQPQLILFTGDITQRARRAQFKEAKEFCRQLAPTPIIAIPGNHDIPLFNIFGRMFAPYYGYQKHFGFPIEGTYNAEGVRITALNSTSRLRHIQGVLPLGELEKKLVEKSGASVHIVALHHPMDCKRPQDCKNILKNANAALEKMAEANIDLVLSGHIHDPFVILSKKTYPHIKRNMILAVAGTSLSSRTRADAPNSFYLFDIESAGTPTIQITRFERRSDGIFSEVTLRRFERQNSLAWAELV